MLWTHEAQPRESTTNSHNQSINVKENAGVFFKARAEKGIA